MLLCGFEKLDNFFVRIDILERLFIMILNSNKDMRTSEIKLVPKMLNLLGCNKENFIKFVQKMNYKTYEKENSIYFKYFSNKRVIRKKKIKKDMTDNPFKVLSQLNLK
jgi:ATP-dependent RNA helicase SUPV3L1/SUV3